MENVYNCNSCQLLTFINAVVSKRFIRKGGITAKEKILIDFHIANSVKVRLKKDSIIGWQIFNN